MNEFSVGGNFKITEAWVVFLPGQRNPEFVREFVGDGLGLFSGIALRQSFVLAQREETDRGEHEDGQKDQQPLPQEGRAPAAAGD